MIGTHPIDLPDARMMPCRVMSFPNRGIIALGQVAFLRSSGDDPVPIACLQHRRCMDHDPQIVPGPVVIGGDTDTEPRMMIRLEGAYYRMQDSGFRRIEHGLPRSPAGAHLGDEAPVQQVLGTQQMDGTHVAIIATTEVIGSTPIGAIGGEQSPEPVVDAIELPRCRPACPGPESRRHA